MTTPDATLSRRREFLRAGLACLWMLLLGGCVESQPATVSADPRLRDPEVAAQLPPDRPPTAKTLYSLAQILAAQGKDAECEFVLRKCVQEYPEFTPAHNSLAELQLRQGRLHEAVQTLSRALAVRGGDPVLSNNLGMCLLLSKDYERALGCFTDAAGRVPECGKYRANMATALGLLGRTEESLALLQQILPRDQAKHNAQLLRQAYDETGG